MNQFQTHPQPPAGGWLPSLWFRPSDYLTNILSNCESETRLVWEVLWVDVIDPRSLQYQHPLEVLRLCGLPCDF